MSEASRNLSGAISGRTGADPVPEPDPHDPVHLSQKQTISLDLSHPEKQTNNLNLSHFEKQTNNLNLRHFEKQTNILNNLDLLHSQKQTPNLGCNVATPPAFAHVFFRRIPSLILEDLPESSVDPDLCESDVGDLTKGDQKGHILESNGVKKTATKSFQGGRTITVIGSPLKPKDFSSGTVRGQTGSPNSSYVTQGQFTENNQNRGTRSLLCQECSGGTYFGVYHTPKTLRKAPQAPTSQENEPLRRSTSFPTPNSYESSTQPLRKPPGSYQAAGYPRYPTEIRYKPIYYGDPWHNRLEKYSYGTHSSIDRNKEIAVSGLQDFCRTMLTVKNSVVDYNHRGDHNSLSKRFSSGGHDNRNRNCGSEEVKMSTNETAFTNVRKTQTPEQQSVISPSLRSPKLVKEVLKRMSSNPSGGISKVVRGHSDVLDKDFVDDSSRLSYQTTGDTDLEAMKVIDEFEKTLDAEASHGLNRTRKVNSPVVPSCQNLDSPPQCTPQKFSSTREVGTPCREHGPQSDNLIEEVVLSGPKVEKELALKTSPPPVPATLNGNIEDKSNDCLSSNEDVICSRGASPAPPKPPRNFDSLPRGFKPCSDQANFDVVSSGVHPLRNGHSMERAVRPGSSSVDSGMCSPQQNYFVVVAIDFGTTYSGYAFSFTRDPENVHMMRKWEGGDPGIMNQKTPTTLLLTPDGRFHSFGYAARDNYHNVDPEEAKRWLYFEKFKMTLHKTENLNHDTMILALNGRSVRAVTIFAHALRYFKNHAIQELSDQFATAVLDEDIRWVVTVPAIWRQPAKQFMRTAAYEAGIASMNTPEQLLIALEPEAASICCRRLRMHQLLPSTIAPQRLSLPNIKEPWDGSAEPAVVESKGTRYMVVDCGGGTVDITVHEIVDEKGVMKELHKATGGPYGSVGIDLEFERLLGDIFGSDFMDQFKKKRPAGFVDLMIAFEARKRNSSPYNIMPLNISFPFSFVDYYRKVKSNSIDSAVKKHGNKEIKWSSQGMLRLEPSCMQRLFQPTLDAIRQHVASVLDHPGVPDIGYLFLVGGFAESQILQKNIRDAFSNRLKVIIPQGVSLAILKGAVLFGMDPTVVNARRSRLTYGVGVLNRFVHGEHPQEKLVVKDGVEWCADVFDKFVVCDQSVCVGEAVIRRYTPARTGQACSVIHIYCSESEDVNFVTDSGVQRCGTLILDLSEDKLNSPDTQPGRREIQTIMIFGDTELKVSAVDVSTGICVKAEVDFFNC